MKFLFLMDPLSSIVMEKDTTFMLMLEAHNRGNAVYYLPTNGLSLKNGELNFHAMSVTPQLNKEQPFIEGKEESLHENDIDVIFIRTDPPFDADYLLHTWLLEPLSRKLTVINNPSGIRTVNEKLWATQFTSIVPPTLVCRNNKDIQAFINEHKEVIAKPTYGFGGQGVFRIKEGDSNINVILETLTKNWSEDIILQQYIADADQGDKRILLLDGEPLGAVLRKHASGDHRNNFLSGGKPEKALINARDKEIIEILKPHLQALGLHLVGIDIIGDFLIEVNVTSPTCLQEINQLDSVQLEKTIIDYVEKCIDQCQSSNRISA